MLYLITGPAGVVKSTISNEIAEKLEKSVLLEGDEFYHHVVSSYIPAWKEGNHLDIFWKEVENSIKLYLDNGYDVIFNYIIDDKKYLELKLLLVNLLLFFSFANPPLLFIYYILSI